MSDIRPEPTYDTINRIAVCYKEALQKEFPQYRFSINQDVSSNPPATFTFTSIIPIVRADFPPLRAITTVDNICVLLAWKNNDIDGDEIILMAEFSSNSIRITCWKHSLKSIMSIDYADPRFTKDIVRDRLAAYDSNSDIFHELDHSTP